MSEGGIQDFEQGQQPPAETFQALVAVVRQLMAQAGEADSQRRPARYMRVFTPAGRAIALTDAEGVAAATASEVLWQMGPHVMLLPPAPVDGVQAACEEAEEAKEVELYQKIKWAEMPAPEDDAAPQAYTLIPEEVSYAAQAMPGDPDALPAPEPETEEEWSVYNRTGQHLLGVVALKVSSRGQKQRSLAMWPMPQTPAYVGKGGYTVSYAGEPYLLPAPTCDQVLTSAYVPDYTGVGFFSPRPNIYYCELQGRLDKHGRLQLSTSLYHAGRRPQTP